MNKMNNFLNLALAPFLAFCLGSAASTLDAAGLKSRKLKREALPQGLKYDGHFVAGLEWTDSTGKNVAVFSQTNEQGSEGESRTLHAAGFRLSKESVRRVWLVQDWVKDCDLDLTCYFETSSFEVTDLDSNGLGEVSFVYRMACNGGMDYIEEKLLLVEDGKKFPVRGETQWELSEKGDSDHYDGPMRVDRSFDHAPAIFRSFAVEKWRKYRRPTK